MSRVNERALGRWLIVAATLLMLLLSAGVYSLWSLSNATRWTTHTDHVRLEIASLSNMLVDAENGVRGYVVAGQPEFLDGYQKSNLEWRPQLRELRELTADNFVQQQRVARLEILIARRLDLLATLRTSFDKGMRGAALTPHMLAGKRVMDAARGILADMERDEVMLDDLRQAQGLRRWQITFLLLSGGVIAFIVMMGVAFVQRRDTQARKLRAEEVARTAELFRVVLEGADIGITVQDPTGALVYANAAGASIVGFETAEALVSAPTAELLRRFEVFDADGLPLPLETLPSRAALRGELPEEIAIRFRSRGSKDQRQSLLRSVPAHDAAGNVAFVINFFQELTEKARRDEQRSFLLRAVDELSSSLDYERTLHALTQMAVPGLADWCAVDLVEDGALKRVAVAHVDPTKVAFIEELERRYPSDPDAATGVPQIIRTGRAEFVADIPHEMIRAAAIDEEHLRLIDSLQLHSYIGVPLVVRGQTFGVITLAMAESDRRYTTQDLEFAEALADRAALAIENTRLFRALETANAATQRLLESETDRRRRAEDGARFADVFIGILGHDLRNPLNAVLMATELVRARAVTDEGLAKVIDRIQSSSRRMSVMITQLLDLARSRLGDGIEVTPVPADLEKITNGVVEEMRLIHPAREIVVSTCEASGSWDEGRLAQVISNLLGNALEHGDPTKPVRVELVKTPTEFELAVHNSGPPIPAELVPTLFDPFRKVMARGARSKGLGLGLFITQQIVAAHGGRIEARSDGAGTTFVARFPRRSVTPATVEISEAVQT